MTFSRDVKEEIARIFPGKACCEAATLAALLRHGGAPGLEMEPGDEGGELAWMLATPHGGVARLALRLLKRHYPSAVHWHQEHARRFGRDPLYRLVLPPGSATIEALAALGLVDLSRGLVLEGVPQAMVRAACCRRSYLRGAFMVKGAVNPPTKSYHIEWGVSGSEAAQGLAALLSEFHLAPRVSSGKTRWRVYLKQAAEVVRCLSLLGATQGLLHFEAGLAMKETKLAVHRRVNCETANLRKAAQAAARQVAEIRYVQKAFGLHRLPPGLAEAARLRLKHPDLTLRELQAHCASPIPKSSLSHRFKRLEDLARQLRNGIPHPLRRHAS